MTVAVASTTYTHDTASISALVHNHTISASDMLLVVFALWVDNSVSSAPAVTSADFGFVDLTFVQRSRYEYSAGRYAVAEIWALWNPAVSTDAVRVFLSEATSHGFAVVAVSLTGATAYGSAFVAQATSSTPAVTVTGATSLVLGGFAAKGGDLYPITWGSGNTELAAAVTGPLGGNDITFGVAQSTNDTVGGTMTGSDAWAMIAFELQVSIPLTVAEAAHGHSADGVTLGVGLTVADAAHSHTADSVTTVFTPLLIVAEGAQGHAADNVRLVPNLIVAEAAHGHAADNAGALTQHYALTVADAWQGQVVESPTLTFVALLNVQIAEHYHTAEQPTITGHPYGILIPQNAYHWHEAQQPPLTQHGTLTLDDTAHAHTADALVVTSSLVVQDAAHGIASEQPTLTFVALLIVPKAEHYHTADTLLLAVGLAVAGAAHGHAADGLTLGQLYGIGIADTVHGHSADNVTIFFNAYIHVVMADVRTRTVASGDSSVRMTATADVEL